MDKLIFNSYAKLNLYLAVLSKRKDSYHNIQTVFERISLCDKITLSLRRDKKINIICGFSDMPKANSRNIAYLAAKLLQDKFKVNTGVDIKIVKRIPVGAGLAGGSSNAATALIGLNNLWKLNLSIPKLAKLAKEIGSDVPFFIYNTPFAQGGLMGDKIKPLVALKNVRFWHILVVPRFKVLTRVIYKGWDKFAKGMPRKGALTRPRYSVKITFLALRKKDLSLLGETLFNSLEEVTTKLYPEVMRVKETLLGLGLKSTLMSGSGPAVFALCPSKKEAVFFSKRLREQHRSWQVFVTQTR